MAELQREGEGCITEQRTVTALCFSNDLLLASTCESAEASCHKSIQTGSLSAPGAIISSDKDAAGGEGGAGGYGDLTVIKPEQ